MALFSKRELSGVRIFEKATAETTEVKLSTFFYHKKISKALDVSVDDLIK